MRDEVERFRVALADRYRLERELGAGGMATVWLAHDLRHDRPVALKLLRADLGAILGGERFLLEIRTTAKLQHPHILPLLDSGEAAGLLFYVMPYAEGESLRHRLEREKQLPIDEALRLAAEVADALDYAHEQGIIHRDIKPENILLSRDHALVADFGIARALSSAGASRLTETGLSLGTPAYMSPEQATAESDLDGRTDQYSLACVVYEMVAGEPPYTGPTAQAIVAKRLLEPIPHVSTIRGVPLAVEHAITRALARARVDRFGSVGEFARALSSPVVPSDAPTAMPARALRESRRVLALLALLAVLVFFLGRWASGGTPDRTGPVRIAVIPFENAGDSADEYFADGASDAIRAQLANIPGLEVIARGSSTPYKRTGKTLREIAKELGVRFLLSGVVRWERVPGGQSVVHVSPELVEVKGNSTPVTKWQQPFDEPLTNVFQLQSDIAGRVAAALDVTLEDSLRRQLAERPTRSLIAYDAYLKGEEVSQGLGVSDVPTLRRAVGLYAQAIAADSSFVLAWARLSRAHALIYSSLGVGASEAEAARVAAERALALGPNLAAAHLAQGDYLLAVRGEPARAAAELGQAVAQSPNDADAIGGLGQAETTMGLWEKGIAHFRRALLFDPRSVTAMRRLAYALFLVRRYDEASVVADGGLAVAPSNLDIIETRAIIPLARGDLPGARVLVNVAIKTVDPAALVAYFGEFLDLCWVLDESQQQLLLGLKPESFDNDRGIWAGVRAEALWLRGSRAAARIFADSSRIAAEEQLLQDPDNAILSAYDALSLAYLGRKADAIRQGERAAVLLPVTKNGYLGPLVRYILACTYIVVGEPEKALDLLDALLQVPSIVSPGWLRIDPHFAPLRGDPRFQKLIAAS